MKDNHLDVESREEESGIDWAWIVVSSVPSCVGCEEQVSF
jgi:hypothetical protein